MTKNDKMMTNDTNIILLNVLCPNPDEFLYSIVGTLFIFARTVRPKEPQMPRYAPVSLYIVLNLNFT